MTTIHQVRHPGPEFSTGQSLHSPVEDLDGWSPWPSKSSSIFNEGNISNDRSTSSLQTPPLPTSVGPEVPDRKSIKSSPQWKPTNSPQSNGSLMHPKPKFAPRKRRRARDNHQQTVKQKIDTKREKNRVAASKCRAKKQAWEKTLESQARVLHNDNMQLSTMLSMLKQEQLRLRELIVRHSWKCKGCSRSMLDGMGPEQLPMEQSSGRVALPALPQYEDGDEDKFGFEMGAMSEYDCFRDSRRSNQAGGV